MEELRAPLADRFVITQINLGIFTEKDFQRKENGAVFKMCIRDSNICDVICVSIHRLLRAWPNLPDYIQQMIEVSIHRLLRAWPLISKYWSRFNVFRSTGSYEPDRQWSGMELLKNYDFSKQRRLSFEYIVFKGLNDSQVYAKELLKLLRGLDCNHH